MKKIRKVIITLVFASTLIACSNPMEDKLEETTDKLTYSNLTDEASQDEVREIMDSAGISDEILDTFFDDVDLFNEAVEKNGLTNNGFITIDELLPEYDVIEMMEMWEAKNPNFLGYNCRITS